MNKTHLFNNLIYETYNIQHGINKIVDIDFALGKGWYENSKHLLK